MSCRCKERGEALRRMPRALVKGDMMRIGREIRMVAKTSIEDARALTARAIERRVKR